MTNFPTFRRSFERFVGRSSGPKPGCFPTFARILGYFLPTSSGQRRALAGLLASAIDEGLDPVPLLDAWARDERGRQRDSVAKLSRLLGAGMTLEQAIARVPGALRPQDATALVVADRLRGDAAGALAVFDSPAASSDPVERDTRWVLGYAFTLFLVSLPLTLFLAVKITPMYQKIFDDFGMAPMAGLSMWRGVLDFLARFWFVPVLAFAVAALASWLAPGAWQGLRRTVGLGGLGVLDEARAADWLAGLDVATRAGKGRDGAVAAIAAGTLDRGLRARLGGAGGGAAAILTPAEVAALEARSVGGMPWVARALARRHRERVLDRKWLLAELILPSFVMLLGAFVFIQAVGIMEPLVELIGGLT